MSKSNFNSMMVKFHEAYEKILEKYETNKPIDKEDFDNLHIWHDFLKAKFDYEREKNAKDVGRS